MANFANLKAAINAVIKQNGQGEITGEVMNQVLTAMVNSLGDNYQFAGVATPSTNPGTPDQNVFYMATQAGTYTNFSAIVLQAGISILLWDGSWSSETFFTIDAEPTSGSNNFITSGAVFDKFKLDGGAYDVTAHNNNATFADLSALLNSENLNTLIPVAIRHGGMSIKFVQTSDNKYVQYLYKVTDAATVVTFTNVANWEKTNLKEELTQLEQKFINIIPVQNNQYLIKEGFVLIQGQNKWVSASGCKYIIYPLTGTGTINVTVNSDVNSIISTLSDYSEPYNDMPGNIVHNVYSNPINYDSTEKYLYILLFYNSDRLPISIFVNGYDILKDVKENIDSGFPIVTSERIANGAVGTDKIADSAVNTNKIANGAVSTSKIENGAINPEKLSSDFNEVRIGIMYYSGGEVLNFDFTNNTCTIPANSRVFLNSKFAIISNDDRVLDLTHAYDGTEITSYQGGAIVFDIATSKCKIVKHTNSIYNRNFIVIATYNITYKKVNCLSTYIQDGKLLNIEIEDGSYVGVLFSSTSTKKALLEFNFTDKICNIAPASKIFANSKVILANTNAVALDISKDYNSQILSYGGCIVWDTSDNTYKVLSYDHNTFIKTQIVLATFNIQKKRVSSPSAYSIDGKMYGLYEVQDITKTISPDFELIQLPNGISWWSDFIVVNVGGVDEMWIFKASSDENHQSNDGAIYRIKMSDWTLIATIVHNFGHCNTVHYDKHHDSLLIANLPGTTQFPSALYIFYNISSWVNSNNLDFNSLNPSIVNVSSVIPASLAAFWAENGFDNRNQVYIISAFGNSPKFAKIVLGMGTNQLANGTYDSTHASSGEFNGTFDILIQPITYSNPIDNDDNKNVIQGGDFVHGQVITANGHDQIYGFIWSYSPKESRIERVEINSVPRKANGEIDYSIGEGLCVHDGYIYHGYIKTSADFRTGSYAVQGYYLAKYTIP